MTSLAHICTSPAAGQSKQVHMTCTMAPTARLPSAQPKHKKKWPVDKHTAVDDDTTRLIWTLSRMSDNVAETQATAHVAEGGANDSCEAMLTGLPGDVCDPAPLRNTPATPRPPGATGNHSARSHTHGCTAKWGTIGFDKGRSGERPPPPTSHSEQCP